MAANQLNKLNLGYLGAKPVVTLSGEQRPVRLILVGCGGTGSWIAPGIARIAWELKRLGRNIEVQFWDYDRVEVKNIPRQHFCPAELSLYKAEVLALRYSAAWGIEIAAFTEPFDPRKARVVSGYDGQPLTIIIGAVDNAAARRTIAQILEGNDQRTPSVWWIDSGNAKSSCQVLIGTHNRVEDLKEAFALSCNALPSPILQHPELLQPLPEELAESQQRFSCAELVAANAQSLTINKLAASLTEDALLRLLTGRLTHFAVYADQESCTVRSRYTNQEEVAEAIGQTPEFFTSMSQR